MAEPEIISPTLAALLDIMTSNEVPETRCIEAAKAIIEYEAPAGVFDLTHQFLLGVAQDARQDVGLKLEALKLIRKVEARRVVPGTTKGADTQASVAAGQQFARANRRLALIREGKWPSTEDWVEGLEPTLGGAIEVEGLAERLERARLRYAASRSSKTTLGQ